MWDWLSVLSTAQSNNQRCVLVTVCKTSGSSPRDAGAKMVVFADGRFSGTIGGGKLEQLALQDAQKCFALGGAHVFHYPLCIRAGQCCGGAVELLMEVLGDRPQFYLFGAGHVGQALMHVMQGTPFQLHLVDDRPEWIHHPDLPQTVLRYSEPWEQFVAQAEWNNTSIYVAIMTHSHDRDLAVLADVLGRNAKYIGLIGSQTKWQRFSQRLERMELSAEQRARVVCPIGIPNGGKAPQEVAISVAGQLLQVYYGSNSISSRL